MRLDFPSGDRRSPHLLAVPTMSTLSNYWSGGELLEEWTSRRARLRDVALAAAHPGARRDRRGTLVGLAAGSERRIQTGRCGSLSAPHVRIRSANNERALLDPLVQSGSPVWPGTVRRYRPTLPEELGVPPADTMRRPLDRPRTSTSVLPMCPLEALLGRRRPPHRRRAGSSGRDGRGVLLMSRSRSVIRSLSCLHFFAATTLIHSQFGGIRRRRASEPCASARRDLDDLASLADVEREMASFPRWRGPVRSPSRCSPAPLWRFARPRQRRTWAYVPVRSL